MKLDLGWDELGDPRARAAGPEGSAGPGGSAEPLARFLEREVQGSAAVARELLAAIDRVEAGELEEGWQQTGNTYTLTLAPHGALLEDEWDDRADPAEVPLADLREALRAWIELLAQGPTSPRTSSG